MYRNEEGVGRALADSGLPRDEVFITTKLNNDGHGHDAAVRALDESLQRLGTDHVDLYLIHWPRPPRRPLRRDVEGLREGAGRRAGAVDRRLQLHGPQPGAAGARRPTPSRRSTRSSCTRGWPRPSCATTTRSTASRPRRGARSRRAATSSPTRALLDLARRSTARRPAQVVLRWHVQLGNIVFPKSMQPERMRENIDVFDFELSSDDMAAIDALDRPSGRGPDPDTLRLSRRSATFVRANCRLARRASHARHVHMNSADPLGRTAGTCVVTSAHGHVQHALAARLRAARSTRSVGVRYRMQGASARPHRS